MNPSCRNTTVQTSLVLAALMLSGVLSVSADVIAQPLHTAWAYSSRPGGASNVQTSTSPPSSTAPLTADITDQWDWNGWDHFVTANAEATYPLLLSGTGHSAIRSTGGNTEIGVPAAVYRGEAPMIVTRTDQQPAGNETVTIRLLFEYRVTTNLNIPADGGFAEFASKIWNRLGSAYTLVTVEFLTFHTGAYSFDSGWLQKRSQPYQVPVGVPHPAFIEFEGTHELLFDSCWPCTGDTATGTSTFEVRPQAVPFEFDGPGTYTIDIPDLGIIDNTWMAPPADCPGDADGNSDVGFDDLTLVLGNFGSTVAPGTNGDVTDDGNVNFDDLTGVLGNFGTDCN